ncbi:MAG: hypothetical protein MSC31_12030 [Solirubrobacteraceae bacterium MAG38_C4-C5]|nr:hypothetical protein [Candidatus Siliceabacter maunaloa]
MVTVYLDQSKWIDLARALHGRADGERFRDALDVARHSVRMPSGGQGRRAGGRSST